MLPNTKEPIRYVYTFKFDDGTERTFDIQLDGRTLALAGTEGPNPDWTRMERFRCPHCPLDAASHEYCPLAASTAALIAFFKDFVSYGEVEVRVQSKERVYLKRASVQESVSSLLGIYMSASGCPVMAPLKPMVRFHLPFASLEETRFRAMSAYLLSQYLANRRSGTADWRMENLVKTYEDVRTVNHNFKERIKELVENDASLNAIVHLDAFAMDVSFRIDRYALDSIAYLFPSSSA